METVRTKHAPKGSVLQELRMNKAVPHGIHVLQVQLVWQATRSVLMVWEDRSVSWMETARKKLLQSKMRRGCSCWWLLQWRQQV